MQVAFAKRGDAGHDGINVARRRPLVAPGYVTHDIGKLRVFPTTVTVRLRRCTHVRWLASNNHRVRRPAHTDFIDCILAEE
jgi:hypothetical protein